MAANKLPSMSRIGLSRFNNGSRIIVTRLRSGAMSPSIGVSKATTHDNIPSTSGSIASSNFEMSGNTLVVSESNIGCNAVSTVCNAGKIICTILLTIGLKVCISDTITGSTDIVKSVSKSMTGGSVSDMTGIIASTTSPITGKRLLTSFSIKGIIFATIGFNPFQILPSVEAKPFKVLSSSPCASDIA